MDTLLFAADANDETAILAEDTLASATFVTGAAFRGQVLVYQLDRGDPVAGLALSMGTSFATVFFGSGVPGGRGISDGITLAGVSLLASSQGAELVDVFEPRGAMCFGNLHSQASMCQVIG